MRRAGICTGCRSQKYGDDLNYKMCGVCRDLRSVYNRQWYQDHVERKLCTRCCEKSWRPHGLELRREPRPRLPERGHYRKCKHHHLGALEYMQAWWERKRNQSSRRHRAA